MVCKPNLGLESQMAGSPPRKRHISDGRHAPGKNQRCVSDETHLKHIDETYSEAEVLSGAMKNEEYCEKHCRRLWQ